MVSTDDYFTHRIKKVMVQNVVAGVPSLNHKKIVSDHGKAHGKGELYHDKYVNHLLSAASIYDATIGFTSKNRLSSYYTNKGYYNIHFYDNQFDYIGKYNIDTACIIYEGSTQEIH